MGEYCFQILYRLESNEISKIVDMKDVEYIENACKESIKAIENIRKELFNQVQNLQEMRIEKQIIVRRRKEYRGNIEISVYINHKHILGNYIKEDMQHQTYKRFNGKEKKAALKYADELKKQYNYIIIKDNWK